MEHTKISCHQDGTLRIGLSDKDYSLLGKPARINVSLGEESLYLSAVPENDSRSGWGLSDRLGRPFLQITSGFTCDRPFSGEQVNTQWFDRTRKLEIKPHEGVTFIKRNGRTPEHTRAQAMPRRPRVSSELDGLKAAVQTINKAVATGTAKAFMQSGRLVVEATTVTRLD